ncbi:MAG: complex I NDUFA9 subunit family protein [Candidatus Dormibacteraeota bacterium]|nr:complex I NDUFA9 subunit family protein [Candidatus Dormibacteraeota bacterium]MBV9526446.1 complex I NDUFA9 subunit family protein [Candidatus Dormibacteraeota bacterium]
MRVAVTGGTGFVGSHLVRALAEDGHDVVVLARGVRRGPKRERVTFIKTDLVAGDGLVDAFTGCDAVVHLVAIPREKGKQTFDLVNRVATERVATAAKQAGVRHLLHQSALGVDPDPSYPYLASKWAGEQAVRGSGVPFTVLRPSVIFGPGDGFFTVLARLVRLTLLTGLIVPVAGNGRALFQPLSIDDMVRCALIALQRDPAGATHELGGPEHLTYDELVLTVARALGARRRIVHVPVRVMLPQVFLMEHTMRNPLVTVGQLRLLDKNNITLLNAVPNAFGFQPQRLADNADYLDDY